MPILIKTPSIITADDNIPKIIKEFIGRISTKTENISIARIKSPSGWI